MSRNLFKSILFIGLVICGTNVAIAQTKKASAKKTTAPAKKPTAPKSTTTSTSKTTTSTTNTSSAINAPTLKVGQEYQGGFIISLKADGKSGLIAAKSNLSAPMNYADANKACQDLVQDGYDDWRLPNMKELGSIYSALHSANKGQVTKGTYLSQDVVIGGSFINTYLMDGMVGIGTMVEVVKPALVRPVRSFKLN